MTNKTSLTKLINKYLLNNHKKVVIRQLKK